MKYCARCILPDTRLGIFLDEEGVCSGCRGHDDKERHIDWTARARAFDTVVAEAKARSKVGNAVRRGAAAHEYDDAKDG